MSLLVIFDGLWCFGLVMVWWCLYVFGYCGELQVCQVLVQVFGVDLEMLLLVCDDKGWLELSGVLVYYGIGWSYSGEVLLVVLGEGVWLGVDLELLWSWVCLLEIVQCFFYFEEVVWLESLDQVDCEYWFFCVWCVKEVVLKVYGQGILFGLYCLQLVLGVDGVLYLCWCDLELGEVVCWYLYEWQVIGEFWVVLVWYLY